MSIPDLILTAVSTADLAAPTATNLVLPTGLPTTLVAAGTAVTSFALETTADIVASVVAASTSVTAAAAAPSTSGGKRILTPEQKVVMAYRTKWSSKSDAFAFQSLSLADCVSEYLCDERGCL